MIMMKLYSFNGFMNFDVVVCKIFEFSVEIVCWKDENIVIEEDGECSISIFLEVMKFFIAGQPRDEVILIIFILMLDRIFG